ncbi:MAG: DUF4412 domain-containing protein [bacterium]
MSRAIRILAGLTLAVLLCLPVLAQADSHIVTKSTTSSFVMMGDTIPASEMTSDIWMGKDQAAMNMDTAKVIIDLTKSMMYMIDHNTKSYTEMPIGSMADMMGAMGMDAEDEESAAALEMMKNMMGSMKFTVTPTEETQKIGDYNCKRFDVAMEMMMMKMNSQVWASTDIQCDMDVYFRLSNAMMAMFPGFEAALTEWKKIEGFPVLQIATLDMMGQPVETRSELVSVEEAAAPAGTYDLPADYKKDDLKTMGN